MLIFIDTTTIHLIHNYFNSLNNDVDSIGVVVVVVVAIEPLIVIYKPLSFNVKKSSSGKLLVVHGVWLYVELPDWKKPKYSEITKIY